MGIYSGDELTYSAPIVCEDVEGYDEGELSAQIAMIESHQNNLTLFEGAIRCDIQEAAMRANGVNEYDIMVFSENVITSMLGKIKAFLMKVWSKIKAIFRGFMARIESVMGKSNKEFVNKYRQEVLRKDLTDFEVKWRKPKKGYTLPVLNFSPGNLENNLKTETWTDKGKDELEKEMRNLDESKEMEKMLKNCMPTGSTFTGDVGEYEKEFIDAVFDDEDTDDKIDIHDVMEQLLGLKEVMRNSKKTNDSLNKAFTQMIKIIDADQKALSKGAPYKADTSLSSDLKHATYSYKDKSSYTGGASYTDNYVAANVALSADAGNGMTNQDKVKLYQKALQMVYKYANMGQQCATKFSAACIKVYKMYNSGLRKVWAKAVAYNRKKDESVLMEAMADLAVWEEDVVYLEESKKGKKKRKGKKGIKGEFDDEDTGDIKESYNFMADVQFK